MGKIVLLFFLLLLISINLLSAQLVYAEALAGASAMPIASLPHQLDDRRVIVLKNYLETYNSPLAPYAKVFIEEADKNQLDWRLLAAISGVESTFGHQIPYNSNNAWGWGIYGDNMIRFSSWEEAIATISGELRVRYINQWGAKDVYQIGKFYAASKTWAQRVDMFMRKIDAFALKSPESLPISL